MNTKPYFDACVQSISQIVRIDSSQAPALPHMPFGKGAADSLKYFLELAASFGFETHNYDNYVGDVIFGDGEEFAILAHLDVVPAGNGWTKDPFGGEIADGKLYGRGTMDDKGPAVICLYGLKALKDSGFTPLKKIKLIVGCNEENGWECMAHYKKVAHMPDYGFTPDADFPAIYAEKGILHFEMQSPVKNAPFTALYGGERANMVCDRVCAEGADAKSLPLQKYGITEENGNLIAGGISAHASTPEKGVNALEKMLACLSEKNADIKHIYDVLFADVFGLKKLHDETGYLSMSPNTVQYKDGKVCIVTDIRYPATYTQEQICKLLNQFGAPYTLLHCQAPLFNDKNGFLITALQKVYQKHTGKTDAPLAIGGGTYARALKNGAGFGPQFADEPSTIHQKDEYITLENVQKLLDIYTDAIYELTK